MFLGLVIVGVLALAIFGVDVRPRTPDTANAGAPAPTPFPTLPARPTQDTTGGGSTTTGGSGQQEPAAAPTPIPAAAMQEPPLEAQVAAPAPTPIAQEIPGYRVPIVPGVGAYAQPTMHAEQLQGDPATPADDRAIVPLGADVQQSDGSVSRCRLPQGCAALVNP
jgi:hypothetical protein